MSDGLLERRKSDIRETFTPLIGTWDAMTDLTSYRYNHRIRFDKKPIPKNQKERTRRKKHKNVI